MLDFCIIGCQKSGTSCLKYNLSKLKGVAIPYREMHFFNIQYERGIDWYENKLKFSKNSDTYIQGEKTSNYITNVTYLQRLKSHYPNVKIIILFRNPVTRAMSHWNHMEQVPEPYNYNPGLTFEEALNKYPSIINNGKYLQQLKNVYQIFGEKNTHIIILERMYQNSYTVFNEVCKFLQIKNNDVSKFYQENNFSIRNVRNYHNSIYIQDIIKLCKYYKPQIKKLYKLLKYNIPEWDDFFAIYSKLILPDKKLLPCSVGEIQPINTENIEKKVFHSSHTELVCIIICVNYADFLRKTLPINKKNISNILIVTSTEDLQTQQICSQNNVLYVTYDFLNSSTKSFQKSKAINQAIKLSIDRYQWILLLDADIIIAEKFRNLNMHTLDTDILYGVQRIIYNTPSDLQQGKAIYDHHKLCIGFFQLFNITSPNFDKSYFGYDENYQYAESGDEDFRKKWPICKSLNFLVTHLGPIETNWKGRISEIWD